MTLTHPRSTSRRLATVILLALLGTLAAALTAGAADAVGTELARDAERRRWRHRAADDRPRGRRDRRARGGPGRWRLRPDAGAPAARQVRRLTAEAPMKTRRGRRPRLVRPLWTVSRRPSSWRAWTARRSAIWRNL